MTFFSNCFGLSAWVFSTVCSKHLHTTAVLVFHSATLKLCWWSSLTCTLLFAPFLKHLKLHCSFRHFVKHKNENPGRVKSAARLYEYHNVQTQRGQNLLGITFCVRPSGRTSCLSGNLALLFIHFQTDGCLHTSLHTIINTRGEHSVFTQKSSKLVQWRERGRPVMITTQQWQVTQAHIGHIIENKS